MVIQQQTMRPLSGLNKKKCKNHDLRKVTQPNKKGKKGNRFFDLENEEAWFIFSF